MRARCSRSAASAFGTLAGAVPRMATNPLVSSRGGYWAAVEYASACLSRRSEKKRDAIPPPRIAVMTLSGA